MQFSDLPRNRSSTCPLARTLRLLLTLAALVVASGFSPPEARITPSAIECQPNMISIPALFI
jgi:hypothetical protein